VFGILDYLVYHHGYGFPGSLGRDIKGSSQDTLRRIIKIVYRILHTSGTKSIINKLFDK
jgi:hypothetical protein